MKFTFSMRKKTLDDFPFTERLDELFEGCVQRSLPEGYGVITASNWRHFPGLQLMIYSLRKRYDTQVCVFDVGMTKDQLKWCDTVPNLVLAPRFNPPFEKINYWEAWVKPLYVANSPFKTTLWIDCDTIITGDIMKIVEAAGETAMFTSDHSGVEKGTYNSDELYQLLPIDGYAADEGVYLNTGVFILDLQRDAEIVEEWTNCVLKAGDNPDIARAIMCWDQGACKWALQKLGRLDLVSSIKSFNFPAKSRQCPFPANSSAATVFLNTIQAAILDEVVIYHWMGSPKPWVKWKNILPIRV